MPQDQINIDLDDGVHKEQLTLHTQFGKILSWGQRREPQRGSLIGCTGTVWAELSHIQTKPDLYGLYLGNNRVAVLPTFYYTA